MSDKNKRKVVMVLAVVMILSVVAGAASQLFYA